LRWQQEFITAGRALFRNTTTVNGEQVGGYDAMV